jgi:lipopolysaccharide biosynthesis glycosyltransferase
MLASQADRTADDGRDPCVVLAADEGFALPLAATVRSALDNLAPGRRLNLYLLDGGISESTKRRLERSWPEHNRRLTWIDVDPAALADAPTSGHVNLVAYYRILMPRLLPTELRRAIYLDADLIVRADLSRLWECELGDHWCLAAQDPAAPWIDSEASLADFDRQGRHLGSPCPVANYRQLGLDPTAAYLNSGVLLVDLDAWRNVDLSSQLLACLEQNKEHALWWDQYALNVVLAGRWGRLDTRWNQGAHVFRFPTWSQSPYDRQTLERLCRDPFIIHFTTSSKPWHASCLHPLRKQFFEYLDRTEWAGWRPARFDRPGAVLEFVKRQEKRLRLARRRMFSRAADLLRPAFSSVKN